MKIPALLLLSFVLAGPTLAQAPCADDAFEDNDTCATATPLGSGNYPGLVSLNGDVDWYAIQVPAGESILFTITMFDPSAICAAGLYDTCGGTLLVPGFGFGGVPMSFSTFNASNAPVAMAA